MRVSTSSAAAARISIHGDGASAGFLRASIRRTTPIPAASAAHTVIAG